MNNGLNLPIPRSVIIPMLGTRSKMEVESGRYDEKTIKEWVAYYNDERISNKEKSNDEIFFIFVTNLLARTSNEKWYPKIDDWLHNEISSLDNINERKVT